MRKLLIPTLPSNKEQFVDRDDVLLHAAFTILVDFFEKEHPEASLEMDPEKGATQEDVATILRLRSLYIWWKYLRHEKHYAINYIDEYSFNSIQLQELVKLREGLWT